MKKNTRNRHSYLTGIFLKDFAKMMFPSVIIFTVFLVIIFAFFTPAIKRQHMQSKEDACRHLVSITMEYLNSLNEDVAKGKVSPEEAKIRAIKRIRNFRYGPELKEYFWIINSKGIFIMHPFRKDLENIPPENITAPDGQVLIKLMKEMSRIANSNPDGGTITYIWNRWDRISELGTKLSYVKKFQPWGWVIGTGVYIDEAEKEIKAWKMIFISAAVFLALFSSAISLLLSIKAAKSRRHEEEARALLVESEENLRIREELFRSIFERSPHAIVITDPENTRIVNANRAFIKMTGYCYEDIIDDFSYITLHPMPEEEKEKVTNNINSGGIAENISSTLICRENRKKDIIYSAIRINYMGEESLLKMIVDLTEEKLLEEQLRQSQKMEVIGRLAGGIAHDFNNMLGVIIGSAELLSLKLKDADDLKKYISRILETGDKASGLIRKLMLFSRKGGAVFQNFNIHDTIMNVADILSHTFDKKIKITLNLKAVTGIISGDPTLMENALLNMSINSRDAMPDGGEIRFTTSNTYIDEHFVRNHPYTINTGYYIEIDITDTGEGIKPELLKKIFDPFFTTKPTGKGTGLGLSAVYGTVKEHGGTIDVYSEPEHGTVFKIYLPCSDEDIKPLKSEEQKPVHGDANILIIDDDLNILLNLKEILTHLGYRVITASGGREGVEIYKNNPHEIDLVICDIIMPEINGIETIRLLKEIRDDVRIIISSGFQEEDTTGIIEETGAKGFIRKPFRMNEISRIIHNVLSGNKI